MSNVAPENEMKQFSVTLGHTTVVVECHTQEEAIEQARKKLCLELPRMWDVIEALTSDRFEVARAA